MWSLDTQHENDSGSDSDNDNNNDSDNCNGNDIEKLYSTKVVQ